MFKNKLSKCQCGGEVYLDKNIRALRCKKCQKEYDPNGKQHKEDAIHTEHAGTDQKEG